MKSLGWLASSTASGGAACVSRQPHWTQWMSSCQVLSMSPLQRGQALSRTISVTSVCELAWIPVPVAVRCWLVWLRPHRVRWSGRGGHTYGPYAYSRPRCQGLRAGTLASSTLPHLHRYHRHVTTDVTPATAEQQVSHRLLTFGDSASHRKRGKWWPAPRAPDQQARALRRPPSGTEQPL